MDLDLKFREMGNLFKDERKYFTDKSIALSLRDVQNIERKISCWPKSRRVILIADLLHMHFNRWFAHDARKFEFLTYYFLLKFIKSSLAKQSLSR